MARPRLACAGWLALACVLVACERDTGDRAVATAGGSAAQVVRVPPPLPGEPALGADYDTMLQRFATNISQGLYTKANLEFLLCNTEKGFRMVNASMDPRVTAMMRRMVALFRSAPGMLHATCP